MPSEAEYVRKISDYNSADRLLDLWKVIEGRNTSPDWAAGKALEYLVLRAFQLEGATVRWPYQVNIGGDVVEQIDGVVYSDGLSCLVECKDTESKVNIEPIAKLRNQLLRRPGTTTGIVFSSSAFTDPALTLAQFAAPQPILLWSGEEIEYAIRRRCIRQALVAKHRHCIEHALPDYNIVQGDL